MLWSCSWQRKKRNRTVKVTISGYFFRASSLKKRRLSEPYKLQKTCKFSPNYSSRKMPEGGKFSPAASSLYGDMILGSAS